MREAERLRGRVGVVVGQQVGRVVVGEESQLGGRGGAEGLEEGVRVVEAHGELIILAGVERHVNGQLFRICIWSS